LYDLLADETVRRADAEREEKSLSGFLMGQKTAQRSAKKLNGAAISPSVRRGSRDAKIVASGFVNA
jgi:hypothetical protein